MLDNGDCILIETKSGKDILIDTGEKENVLLEYLLDKGIMKIDYLMISHFDSDHCLNAIEIIEKLKVKNIIISKQIEHTQEFETIINLCNKEKVKVIQVQAGDVITIDKQVCFKIYWPDYSTIIKENAINNNAIVAKLFYKNFTMLFTGDIEEEAEKTILEKYKKEELKSTILKVAHHGSNTSSTENFLEAASPQVALIGVGINNKYGHPNNKVINRLQTLNCKIYRTDKKGEINLLVNKRGEIKIKTHCN